MSYLSRIHLQTQRLKPGMISKWNDATPYAAHQWLWQLFLGETERPFLFRQEPQACFFVLSECPPTTQHNLFSVETKPFTPQIEVGQAFDFQLRANPVITRQKKRYDVLMDAKFQARARGKSKAAWWNIQTEAACLWLDKQGDNHGFALIDSSQEMLEVWAGGETEHDAVAGRVCVKNYQQHRFQRQTGQKPIMYSSVDYTGTLRITNVAKFQQVLFQGLGKSKSLGCGLMMIKRPGL